jgi:protein-S-isoprenylcysteine O-methyltransferase Ste14
MHDNLHSGQMEDRSDLRKQVRRRMIQVAIQFLIIGVILFGFSGRLDWRWAWIYFGVSLVLLLINAFLLPPELIAERGEVRENIEKWDRKITIPTGLLTLGTFIVAGLDQRFGWSQELSVLIHIVALIFYALAQGLFTWAMVSNPFFSTSVLIQFDRNHTVSTGGPYRYVRHPGYVGYILSYIATSLALGSLWALIPSVLILPAMALRTALEDKTLLEKLDGYKEYADQVRYRLLPGIW